jgi:nucleotide-binding universal stress UspA family protein
MFKHIMLATDFSPSAMWAANTARALARALGAKLTLAHGFDPEQRSYDEAHDFLTVLRDEHFDADASVDLCATPHRRPDAAICIEADLRKVDLVVLGRHGQHGMAERLLGTVTERVVRHAPCSVWVTHPAQSERVVLTKKIVVGVDLSAESELAVDVGAVLARQLESWVTLLHVYDILPPLDLLREPYIDDVDHDFASRLSDKLETMRKERLGDLPAGHRVLRDKSTVTAICDYAGNENTDLVVLGTHGFTGVRRLLIGSVAERVLRHAPCSVLVVRKRASA